MMRAAPADVPVAVPVPSDIVVSSESEAGEWDAYVAAHPSGTVDHLYRWRTIFKDVFGHDSEYLVARRGADIVGVLPLVLFKSRLFGRQIVSLPMLNYGGMLCSERGAVAPLLEAATAKGRAFGAAHVELRHQERLTALPARQHKVSMRRALPDTAEALWGTIDRKVRNQVRKAQKADLSVDVGGRELVERFYRVFAENMRDLGTPVYSRRLFEQVLELFPERARLHVVSQGGRPIAASCVLRFRETDLVPWASSLRAYSQLCPNMLLYWSMLEGAVLRGATTFDFGRSSPDAGTYRFKEQWGAQPAPQFWEYVLLNRAGLPEQGPEGAKLSLAIECWKRLPMWLARVVGPHVVRHIP